MSYFKKNAIDEHNFLKISSYELTCPKNAIAVRVTQISFFEIPKLPSVQTAHHLSLPILTWDPRVIFIFFLYSPFTPLYPISYSHLPLYKPVCRAMCLPSSHILSPPLPLYKPVLPRDVPPTRWDAHLWQCSKTCAKIIGSECCHELYLVNF